MTRFLRAATLVFFAVHGAVALAGSPTCPTISMAPLSLPNGDLATAYTSTVTSAGGTAPVTIDITHGILPNGVNLTDNGNGTATFSGTSTQTGAFEFTITATDVNGCSGGRTYTPTFATATSTTVLALTTGPNPSVFGQSLTFTATVTSGSGTPAGNVTFMDGAATLGTVALNGAGVATFTTSTLSVGTHSPITAVYAGNATFAGSTSNPLSQTVNQAATTTTLVSSLSPSVFGQSVTLTATVAAVAPGAGTPTGTVTFFDGVTNIGSGPLNGSGVATLATTTLTVGAHQITATYGADTNFSGSTSSILTQTVNQASTTTTLTSDTNPSVFGQNVTFTATVAAVAPGGGTPTGTVQFKDGVVNLGAPVALAGGVATFSTSSLSVSTHSITAVYSADTNFSASTSSAVSQVVNQSATSTALFSSINPSAANQSVTFTAIVTATAPGAGTPTGTVTFFDGVTNIGSGAVNGSGQATFATSTLTVGSHQITATYNGDVNFITSTSAPLTQTVNLSPSSTALVSSVNPTVFGQSTTFTATVTATGTPTGTVAFMDGAVLINTSPLVAGVATFSTGALTVGAHSITAVYSGDSNFATSTSAPVIQTVNQAATTTTVGSSANPSVFGQSVTFTATVAPVAPGAGTPTGTVTFKDGVANLGAPVSMVGGVATLATSALSVSTHSITAVYNADTNFTTSTSSALSQVVNQAATTTTVISSQNPSVFGQSVTFTATVAPVAPGAGTPTGTVQFKDGAANLGAPVALAAGVATFNTSSLTVSTHSITAVYSADTNFTTSTSSALSQVVNQSATTTTVVSSLNPSVFGDSVTFTATVTATAPGAGTPTGTVQFKDGAVNLGAPAALAGGVATFATTTLTVGIHSITAVYGADTNFSGSTSSALSQTVNKAPTTTTVASSLNPSVFQNSVTFTATVTSTSAGTITGTVNFLDGVTSIGSGALAAGTATFTTTTLTGGTHSITAVYSGDANFATSTSSALSQVVNKADQTITITSTPPAFGATVAPNHTYTVVATATSGLVVAITIDPASASVCSVAGTTVTFNTAGVCTINANQAGDGNWNPAPQVQQSVTVLVPATANPESHPVTGNVGIASTSSVLTNDTGTNIVIKSYGATTGAEQTTIGNATPTAQGGSVTLVAGGTYTFTPASNFTGTDSFKYIIDNGLVRPSTGTVTLNVTDRIIIVSVAGGGSCSPVTPSPCTLAVADAAPIASGKDLVFVESGTYPGAAMSLFAAQNLVGQQVSLAQAITDIGGITFAVDSVAIATIAASTRPVLNNGGTVVTLGGNNLVEYFNINPTAGSAILGNGIASGTSTVHDITITGTGGANGVNLTANAGATFNFSNLVTTTASGNAFSATGGGTVNVTTGAVANTLTSTTGMALNVVNTTIGASGLTFLSISANGAAKGIVLNNTGIAAGNGGLSITGTGTTDGTGGTIQNISGRGGEFTTTKALSLKNVNFTNANTADGGVCTDLSTAACNAAIYLSGVVGVTLDNINITGTTAQEGINGLNVSDFNLTNSTLTSCGTSGSVEEGCIKMRELTGTCTINASDLSFPGQDVVEIVNTAGALMLNVDSSIFRDSQSSGAGGNGLQARSQGTASMVVNVINSSFLRLRANGMQATAINSASNDVDVTNSTFDTGAGTMIGLDLDADNTGTLVFNVQNNPRIWSSNGPAINVFGDTSATINGRISNNPDVRVLTHVGGNVGSGIRTNINKNATAKIEVKNNVVNVGSDDAGIDLSAIGKTTANPGGATNTLDATVTGNTVTIGATSTYGVIILGATNAGDTNALCANVGTNAITRNPASIASFRARVPSAAGFFRLQSFATNPEVTWNGNGNTPVSAGGSEVSFGGSGTFAACTANLPTNPGPN